MFCIDCKGREEVYNELRELDGEDFSGLICKVILKDCLHNCMALVVRMIYSEDSEKYFWRLYTVFIQERDAL
ncbi:hypothetical protein COU54_00970 [Candidatus Pacearchaeota archaeon CG10_big_fil_rev_8_21_14_0_10_31_24]|nr:MAG: hypothetical protein COU54_00970 [Candidatus Pacearchaeota archaeon CG10_big_fil_rev_8_21_14_0_10_31_24]